MKIKYKYKKYILVLFVILLPAILSACFKATISAQIDSDFMVTYRGDIEIDLKKYDNPQHAVTQNTLLTLSEYWKQIGYESEVEIDNGIYHTYFMKSKQCTSYEEAFAELYKMMSDEYSPFESISYNYSKYENYDEYNIQGKVNMQQVIDKEVLSELPADIQQNINDEIENMSAYIIFDLPNHENSPPTSVTEAKYDIKYNEITSFDYTGKIDNNYIGENGSISNSDNQYYNMVNYILAGILGVFIVLTIITLAKSTKL